MELQYPHLLQASVTLDCRCRHIYHVCDFIYTTLNGLATKADDFRRQKWPQTDETISTVTSLFHKHRQCYEKVKQKTTNGGKPNSGKTVN